LRYFPSPTLVKKWRWLAVAGGNRAFQQVFRFSCGTFKSLNHYLPIHSPKILSVKLPSELAVFFQSFTQKSGGGWR